MKIMLMYLEWFSVLIQMALTNLTVQSGRANGRGDSALPDNAVVAGIGED